MTDAYQHTEVIVPNVPDSVPGAVHYSKEYFTRGRVFSYAHQLDAVLNCSPANVLEVGVGSGVVAAALRAMGLQVRTLDIQPELRPDVLGTVLEIPLPNASFDVGLCCQVLEHLPFSEIGIALRELRRVCSVVIISLPDVRPHYRLSCRLPLLRHFEWTGTRVKMPPKERIESAWKNSGHYWEIGFPGYPLKMVRSAIIAEQWIIDREWRVPELPWHHFFVLVKSS